MKWYRCRIFKKIYKLALRMPFLGKFSNYFYQLLGVNMTNPKSVRISSPELVGDYSNLYLSDNSEITAHCFLVAKEKIIIGENSTLAYGVTILTSANPNGPYNKLSRVYPKILSPVIIGDDVWIGANSTILPGVKIGSFSVVAAGSVVTSDVPSGVLVAGVPAQIKKKLTVDNF